MSSFAGRQSTLVGSLVVCGVLCTVQLPAVSQAPSSTAQVPDTAQLRPTVHNALPEAVDDYWFVPPRAARGNARDANLASAATEYAAGNFAAALTAAEQAAAQGGPLAEYALLYKGLSQLRLSQPDKADGVFDAVLATRPEGHIHIAAMIGKAEAAELRGNHQAAAELFARISAEKTIAPEDILSRLGHAALAAGDRKRAAEAFMRVYYEFPLSDAATAAAGELASLQDQVVRNGYKADLARAQVLFGARKYPESRTAFADLQRQVSGDDRELVDLRLAESDFFLKRYAAARDEVQPYLENASRKAEASYFFLSAIRELGDRDRYLSLCRQFVADFPDSTWSDEALNNLGTYYILANQDDLAAQAFRESYEKFPTGQHAERVAWKYGWWAYKTGNYAETIRVFESAATSFPRSDYRPPFLYWAARAHGKMGDRAGADARMRLVYTDYLNSYYGRLANKYISAQRSAQLQLNDDDGDVAAPAVVRTAQPSAPEPPPNAPLIRRLLAAGLYDDALSELRYAQKVWGSSPPLEATLAWVYHAKGDLRRAISLMRRAYPQHLTAGGEGLPADILEVIFPLTYWDSIRRYAAARGLDPYLVAALIAQESTFDPGAHSSANAWGLMQLVPATGRRLARDVGIRRFSTSMLTTADVNIRLGTLYFSRLVEQFGGTYYALASYNAGESRVVRWKTERPGLDEDEFIDDIPFPETQNYVKRVLGTAEDYRRLYVGGGVQPRTLSASAAGKSAPSIKSSRSTKKKIAPPAKKKPPVKRARRRRS